MYAVCKRVLQTDKGKAHTQRSFLKSVKIHPQVYPLLHWLFRTLIFGNLFILGMGSWLAFHLCPKKVAAILLAFPSMWAMPWHSRSLQMIHRRSASVLPSALSLSLGSKTCKLIHLVGIHFLLWSYIMILSPKFHLIQVARILLYLPLKKKRPSHLNSLHSTFQTPLDVPSSWSPRRWSNISCLYYWGHWGARCLTPCIAMLNGSSFVAQSMMINMRKFSHTKRSSITFASRMMMGPNFGLINAHEDPLKPSDPSYKGSKFNVMINRKMGRLSLNPSIIAADDPVTCAIYAR